MFPARRRRRSPGACGRPRGLPREGEASCKAHLFTGVTPPEAEQWQGPPPGSPCRREGSRLLLGAQLTQHPFQGPLGP